MYKFEYIYQLPLVCCLVTFQTLLSTGWQRAHVQRLPLLPKSWSCGCIFFFFSPAGQLLRPVHLEVPSSPPHRPSSVFFFFFFCPPSKAFKSTFHLQNTSRPLWDGCLVTVTLAFLPFFFFFLAICRVHTCMYMCIQLGGVDAGRSRIPEPNKGAHFYISRFELEAALRRRLVKCLHSVLKYKYEYLS